MTAPIYFAQLLGRKEVQFDWAKFTWIGTPEENDELFFLRSDQPYKTLLDLRKASEPPRCGASGVGSTGFYIPKLMEEIFGVKINMVTGYPGAADVDLAVEKNEVHCRGTTISAFFGREPGKTWAKNGFVRFLVQTGDKRNHRLPDTPTIWELMDQEKGKDAKKRLARVVLGPALLAGRSWRLRESRRIVLSFCATPISICLKILSSSRKQRNGNGKLLRSAANGWRLWPKKSSISRRISSSG